MTKHELMELAEKHQRKADEARKASDKTGAVETPAPTDEALKNLLAYARLTKLIGEDAGYEAQ